mmetsp:Transcript_35659/g.88720  ORF Transcript_35659/g.88720 Transcript_35659/m.88720 type:complete len:145 (-) Transcript_35659:675-1109(-)
MTPCHKEQDAHQTDNDPLTHSLGQSLNRIDECTSKAVHTHTHVHPKHTDSIQTDPARPATSSQAMTATRHVSVSMRELLSVRSPITFDGSWVAPESLKIRSTTPSSVAVVSIPQKAAQSLATTPAPMTSDPLLMVPAVRGICSS